MALWQMSAVSPTDPVLIVSAVPPDTGLKIQASFSSILLQQMSVNVSVAVQAQVKLVEAM